jgi:hypothetical protein
MPLIQLIYPHHNERSLVIILRLVTTNRIDASICSTRGLYANDYVVAPRTLIISNIAQAMMMPDDILI